MIGIIYGLLYQVSCATLTLTQKTLTKEIDPRGALGVHLFFFPIGVVGLIGALLYDSSPVSDDLVKFFALVVLFGIFVAFNTYLSFSLLRNINTSSFFKYRLGNKLILALIGDFLFFGIIPSYISFLIGVLFILSGSFLNNATQKKIKSEIFIKVFLVSLGVTISSIILKELTLITTNFFAGIFITQIVTHIIVGLFGIKYIKEIIKNKKLIKISFIYNLIIFFLVIFEFYAFRELSLFMIVALSNVRFIIFLIFDLMKKELFINKRMIIGTLLGFLGVGLLMYSNL